MSINVKNGTPLHGSSLCGSCTHAHIQKGYRVSEEAVFCRMNYPMHAVPFPVRECTDYVDKNRQDLNAMERIALIVNSVAGKRVAGFVSGNGSRSEHEIEIELESL